MCVYVCMVTPCITMTPKMASQSSAYASEGTVFDMYRIVYTYTRFVLYLCLNQLHLCLRTLVPAAPVQIDTAAQISVTMQTVVIVVKITKTEFLVQESQIKQAAATAGGVNVSQVEFISIEDIDLRCELVWLCSFCDWNCVCEDVKACTTDIAVRESQ